MKDIEKFAKEYPEDPTQREQALHWYTLETFAFRLLNVILRSTTNKFILEYIRIFFQDLYSTIEFEHKFQRSSFSSKDEIRVYRATELSKKECEFF